MINKVTLIGNLGSDPEIKELSSGSKLARLSLATNENYQDSNGDWQTTTEWHSVILWRAQAERAERNLKKGMQIYVEGKIKYRKWQDENGVDKYATDIEARVYRILGKREGNDYDNRNFPAAEPVSIAAATSAPDMPSTTPVANTAKDNLVEEDDLPF